jgi:hypothetical protein
MQQLLLLSALLSAAQSSSLLYSLPPSLDLSNASIVRLDPSASSSVLGTTLITFWRLGPGPLRPLQWQVGSFTGSPAPAALSRGLLPASPDSSCISFSQGTFGAVLNTSTTPIAPGQSLGTITVEQSWTAEAAPLPWAAAGGAVDLSVMYQPATALKASGAIAVYSSWTIGLRSLAPQDKSAFIWYETALFDFQRPLGGDEVWRDTISGSVIVHGVLGAPSAFHTAAPDSAAASSSPWAGFRRMHFSVSAAQVQAAVLAANAKFNLTLHSDAAQWALVHFNVELEGTAGVSAGHSLHSLSISQL